MAWDRKVKMRVIVDMEITLCANREEVARDMAREVAHREFGHAAQVVINSVTPEGDWEDESKVWEHDWDRPWWVVLEEVMNKPHLEITASRDLDWLVEHGYIATAHGPDFYRMMEKGRKVLRNHKRMA